MAAERPFASLLALLALQRPFVAAAALCSTLAAALALAPFFIVARMAPAIYSQPARLGEVRSLALWAAGALLLRYVLVAGANMFAHVAAFRVLHALRLRLAHKLGAVPLSFFGRHSTGELKKTLMDDVNQIEAFVAHNFPDGVAAAVVPLATAVALAAVNWRMALARSIGKSKRVRVLPFRRSRRNSSVMRSSPSLQVAPEPRWSMQPRPAFGAPGHSPPDTGRKP